MAKHLQWANDLKRTGEQLGRAGMADRVIKAVREYDGTYKGAMRLAGRLKAIAQMARCDQYWLEQVEHGFHKELNTDAGRAALAPSKAKEG